MKGCDGSKTGGGGLLQPISIAVGFSLFPVSVYSFSLIPAYDRKRCGPGFGFMI